MPCSQTRKKPAERRKISAGIANNPFPTPVKGKQEKRSLRGTLHSFPIAKTKNPLLSQCKAWSPPT